MNKFYNETLHRLKATVNELEVEADCSIQRIEAVILLIGQWPIRIKGIYTC